MFGNEHIENCTVGIGTAYNTNDKAYTHEEKSSRMRIIMLFYLHSRFLKLLVD